MQYKSRKYKSGNVEAEKRWELSYYVPLVTRDKGPTRSAAAVIMCDDVKIVGVLEQSGHGSWWIMEGGNLFFRSRLVRHMLAGNATLSEVNIGRVDVGDAFLK